MLFSQYFDVGFIAGADIVDAAFVFQVEGVTMTGSRLSVIEDGLAGDMDIKDHSENESGFFCTHGERDIESQNQSQYMIGVVYFGEIHSCLSWFGVFNLFRCEVILSVLVIEFEVGGAELLHHSFGRVEFFEVLTPARTIWITALINGDVILLFPVVEGVVAIGAKKIGTGFFFFLETLVDFEGGLTDFTNQL